MSIQQIFDDASSLMTVISFATFMSIVAWTYILHKQSDFDAAASLPFADAHLDEGGENGDV